MELGIMKTLNPNKGNGIVESLLAAILIVTYCYITILGLEVPAEFYAIISLVIGFMFGRNAK